jgi:hypothetical protein
VKKVQIIQQFSNRLDPPEHCYSAAEEALFHEHIKKYFGVPKQILREPWPEGVRADIAVIAPSEKRAYYTLLTVGMGAFIMDVPPDLIDCELERAELMLRLPPGWKPGRPGDKWRWPLEWLRILAHIPVGKDMWLGWGHIVPAEEAVGKWPFSCMLLTDPANCDEAASYCEMPDGSIVNVYQVTPLFEDEMKYRQANGTDALLKLFEERLGRYHMMVMDMGRKSCLAK